MTLLSASNRLDTRGMEEENFSVSMQQTRRSIARKPHLSPSHPTLFDCKEFSMANPTDTLAAWQKAVLDATIACTQATLASAEQLVTLNLETARKAPGSLRRHGNPPWRPPRPCSTALPAPPDNSRNCPKRTSRQRPPAWSEAPARSSIAFRTSKAPSPRGFRSTIAYAVRR